MLALGHTAGTYSFQVFPYTIPFPFINYCAAGRVAQRDWYLLRRDLFPRVALNESLARKTHARL